MSTTRYRVVFDNDLRQGPNVRPKPMTCSTPNMALRMASAFGAPRRLVVDVVTTQDVPMSHEPRPATFDLTGIDLTGFPDWLSVADAIRARRKRTSADA